MDALNFNFTFLPSLILFIGLCDDLVTKKFHNWLFLFGLVIVFISHIIFFDTSHLLSGVLGLMSAFLVAWPLTRFSIIGAGDLKLLMVFGFATNYHSVFFVLLGSFFWGALLGIIHSLLTHSFKDLFINIKLLLFSFKSKNELKLHQIPYSVALFLGWLSYLFRGELW